MKRISQIFALATLTLAAPAYAEHDYPTIEVVGYVMECMKENGGQTLENMYSCSCRFDKLANSMGFDEYESAVTQRRFMKMPGEKGGVFRESDSGRKLVKEFEKTLAEVNKSCPVVRNTSAKAPPE